MKAERKQSSCLQLIASFNQPLDKSPAYLGCELQQDLKQN